MQLSDIRLLRLQNQHITAGTHTKAPQIVSHLVAMQAQEYAMAKWAIGLRLNNAAQAQVELAFQVGKILRTHLMRPTWHFVTPQDIRWLLKLTAPNIQRLNAGMYRKTELDSGILGKACRVFERSLSDNAQLTREALAQALFSAGIKASGHRLSYIMMNAELEGVLCSGARIGKRFTYALLDKQAPPCPSLVREEAVVRLAARYFASRGPATARDFSCWSGLSMADAHTGCGGLGAKYTKISLGKDDYYFVEPPIRTTLNQRATFLLPDYDEYGMGYKNRVALAPRVPPLAPPSEYSHWLVIKGQIEGTWQFSSAKRENAVAAPYHLLTGEDALDLTFALERHRSFWTAKIAET